jgi:hypothetical protein
MYVCTVLIVLYCTLKAVLYKTNTPSMICRRTIQDTRYKIQDTRNEKASTEPMTIGVTPRGISSAIYSVPVKPVSSSGQAVSMEEYGGVPMEEYGGVPME